MMSCCEDVPAACLHQHAACGATLSTPTVAKRWDCSCQFDEVDHLCRVGRPDHSPHASEHPADGHVLYHTPDHLSSVSLLKLPMKLPAKLILQLLVLLQQPRCDCCERPA